RAAGAPIEPAAIESRSCQSLSVPSDGTTLQMYCLAWALAALPAAAFLGLGVFLAGAFLAGAFLAAAFFVGAFFVGAFFAGVFFAALFLAAIFVSFARYLCGRPRRAQRRYITSGPQSGGRSFRRFGVA